MKLKHLEGLLVREPGQGSRAERLLSLPPSAPPLPSPRSPAAPLGA